MPPSRTAHRHASPRRFVAGALIFGFGLGGLADGIVLHQVLQWHNLVSAQVANETLGGLRTNVFWDGVFHLSVTALLIVGVALLWSAWTQNRHATGNGSALIGLTLIGWGAFHVVDQLLFHEALNLHDIRQDTAYTALYNWGYFALGLVLTALGWALWRTRGRVHRSGFTDAARRDAAGPMSRGRR